MSAHTVEVVTVNLEPHPNADSLSIVRVHGFTVCVRTDDWADGELGAYIPPDSIVPDTEQFAFLGKHRRIRVKRLRGVVSMGLLVKAPAGSGPGDDVMAALGVTHYEPPMSCQTGGDTAPAPDGYRPCYDVENARRYATEVFVPGEPLWVTEKIHGANGRWCFDGERFHCGSRTSWKVESESSIWWQALRGCPALAYFLREHPEITVYGEVYGKVQDLTYGVDRGVRVAVFDLLENGTWLDAPASRLIWYSLPWVPLIARDFPYEFDALAALAERASAIPGADHIAEGIVAKPMKERTHAAIGRVQLKIVSNAYLERP